MSDDEPVRIMRAPDGHGSAIARIFAPRERRVVRREVIESVQEVQQELVEARAEASSILEAAEAEAQSIRDAAQQEGVAQAQREMLEALGRARAEYDTLVQRAEQDMVELAFRLARAIVGEELQRRPDTIVQIVANQLQHVRGRRQVVIAVHPDNRALLEAHLDGLSRLVDGARVYIETNEAIDQGGCVLETEAGRIDARLDVQLQIMREALGGG